MVLRLPAIRKQEDRITTGPGRQFQTNIGDPSWSIFWTSTRWYICIYIYIVSLVTRLSQQQEPFVGRDDISSLTVIFIKPSVPCKKSPTLSNSQIPRNSELHNIFTSLSPISDLHSVELPRTWQTGPPDRISLRPSGPVVNLAYPHDDKAWMRSAICTQATLQKCRLMSLLSCNMSLRKVTPWNLTLDLWNNEIPVATVGEVPGMREKPPTYYFRTVQTRLRSRWSRVCTKFAQFYHC